MSVWAKVWAYRQRPKRIDADGKVTDRKHPAAKSVLVALAEFPGPGQRDCWPSQETLADMTDYSTRQVRACLSDLETQGLIKRTQRRRRDGSRRSDRVTLLGPISEFGPGLGPSGATQDTQPEESSGSDGDQPEEGSNQPEESSGHEPSGSTNRQSTSEEFVTTHSSGEPQKAELSSASPENEADEKTEGVKPESPGAFAVRELMDRVNTARERGAPIHDPPSPGNYGQFFKNRMRRNDTETLLLTLDYLVAKASGEIEGEKKAWCGFDTALDAVLAGWRPKASLTLVETRPEDDEEWNEIMRMQQEVIGG